MFSVGLKGIDPSGAEKVEALVLETLRALADEGIDRMTVEASLNTIEFRLRENNFGSFPRGIAAMLRSLKTWLYDRDPFDAAGVRGAAAHAEKPHCGRRALFREPDCPLSPGQSSPDHIDVAAGSRAGRARGCRGTPAARRCARRNEQVRSRGAGRGDLHAQAPAGDPRPAGGAGHYSNACS